MSDSFGSTWHIARKEHRCDLCGEKICPGERYSATFCVDGPYGFTFKEHEKCSFIANEIYDYDEPEEGLCNDWFIETCIEISRTFICPDCEKKDDCLDLCLDRMYEFFQKYELYESNRSGLVREWMVRERKKDDVNEESD